MNSKVKQCISIFAAVVLCVSCLLPAAVVKANDISSLQQETSSLEAQSVDLDSALAGMNKDIKKIGKKIADAEIELEDITNDIDKTEEQLQIAAKKEEDQYEAMKERIRFMYENGGSNLVTMILEAKTMSDFLNKVDFVTNISQYDRNQLNILIELKETIQEQEEYLLAKKDEQKKTIKELNKQNKELKAKAKETKTDLAMITEKIASLKTQIREAQAEAERQAMLAAAQQAAAQQQAHNAAPSRPSNNTTQKPVRQPDPVQDPEPEPEPEQPSYQAPSNGIPDYGYPYEQGGALTPNKGVVYFDGHKETYYSQRVLPGGALQIPGRHVAADGTIRDGEGLIVVASSDLPFGTLVNTSLGPAKVYDCGCASGTIDIYTDW
ncbi:MAG: hypothetical protein MJ097_06495 [Dorea sp.]|nr:hypothetical protein [Dorea sp.]